MAARPPVVVVLPALLVAGLAALAWALVSGEARADWSSLLAALGGSASFDATVIRELRLPRAVAAYAGGGLLAVHPVP